MPTVTTQPPPQLSLDGRWRWDGTQWTCVKPSKRWSDPRGPGAPQASPDGRWWWTGWNGYRWVPADQASFKPPKAPGLAPARLAVIFGLGALVLLPPTLLFMMEGTYDTPSGEQGPWGWDGILTGLLLPFAGVVLGVVFGVQALVSLRQRDDRSQRRMAWVGIAASLAGAVGVVLIGLAAAAVAAGS